MPEHRGAARGVPLAHGAHEFGRGYRRCQAPRIVWRGAAFATMRVNLVAGDALGVRKGKNRARLHRVYEPAEQIRVQRALDGSGIVLSSEGSTTRRTSATIVASSATVTLSLSEAIDRSRYLERRRCLSGSLRTKASAYRFGREQRIDRALEVVGADNAYVERLRKLRPRLGQLGLDA